MAGRASTNKILITKLTKRYKITCFEATKSQKMAHNTRKRH